MFLDKDLPYASPAAPIIAVVVTIVILLLGFVIFNPSAANGSARAQELMRERLEKEATAGWFVVDKDGRVYGVTGREGKTFRVQTLNGPQTFLQTDALAANLYGTYGPQHTMHYARLTEYFLKQEPYPVSKGDCKSCGPKPYPRP